MVSGGFARERVVDRASVFYRYFAVVRAHVEEVYSGGRSLEGTLPRRVGSVGAEDTLAYYSRDILNRYNDGYGTTNDYGYNGLDSDAFRDI